MTLKEYLESNGVNATPDQRSRLGHLISSPGDYIGRVIEDGHNVKDYRIEYLKSEDVCLTILSFLSTIRDGSR